MTAETENRSSPIGVEINGTLYPIPTLEDITLDEERILYLYANITLADFAPAHPQWSDDEKVAWEFSRASKLRHPDYKKALLAIVYKRQHPDADDSEVWKIVGTANALSTEVALISKDSDAVPPATSSQKQPDDKRSTSEPSPSTGSGSISETSSESQDKTRDDIGTTESGTSSRPLHAVTSGS